MDIDRLNPKLLLVNHIGRGNMPTDTDTFGERITRWHELDIITWGDGVDHVMGQDFPVRKGDIFYRVPGMRNKHDLPYHCYFFVFDPFYSADKQAAYREDALQMANAPGPERWEPIEPFAFATQPYLGKATDLERLNIMCANLFMEYSNAQGDPLLIKIMFLQLLREVVDQLRYQEDKVSADVHYQQYRQMIYEVQEWMRNNPVEPFSMRVLADRVGMSYSFFSRVFKAVSGMNFAAYATQVKLNFIKSQLMDTTKTVTEIALDSGFSDPNYLYILFRRELGCTPAEYRVLTARGRYGGR